MEGRIILLLRIKVGVHDNMTCQGEMQPVYKKRSGGTEFMEEEFMPLTGDL
jgi:hypothetical protein